jgi:D-sedoheptulose 7-phosphate isomerase
VSPESTDFLYPFIDAGAVEAGALVDDLTASASAKAAESARLARQCSQASAGELEACASAMAERLGRGGRVLTMGNGGSSTDADAFAELLHSPPSGQPLPAWSLVSDQAVVTALGNDVGFELVFSRQVIAYGRPEDVLVGFSTSGSSANLLTAFAEAHRRGLLTVGLAGYEGGDMASSPDVEHCLVVHSQSVHRIQETQAALAFGLWERLQGLLGGEGHP